MSRNIEEARTVLKRVFGYEAFRPGQDDIVSAVLNGRDVLGVMPTGGGKSICYQVPALLFPACTLVISPLVALMKDQTERLRQHGVEAYALHAGMSQGDINNVMFDAHAGRIKLLYVAPERLESASFRQTLSTVSLSLLAVDEAHCVSEWGHDFRPAYRSIAKLFESRQRIPIVALTATATPDVRADIITSLGLHKPVEIVRGFDRSNLSFRVERTPHKVEFITRLAKAEPQSVILVYAGSRRRVDTITDELSKRGIPAVGYHAGKTPDQRSAIQEAFVGGASRVLVATNAFGMGIDKADVRHVIHTDLTLTVEAYYQEAGRAGRDGLSSTCTLLYQPQDRRLMDFFIESTYPESRDVSEVLQYLFERSGVAPGDTASEPIHADTSSIAADLHRSVALVNGVLGLLERLGILLRTTPTGRAEMRIRTTVERFREFIQHAPTERRHALEAIFRLAAFSDEKSVSFSLHGILKQSSITMHEFGEAIRMLHVARIIRYTPPEGGGGIVLLQPRPRSGALALDLTDVHQRRDHAKRKLDAMVRYADTPQCKRNFILNYFGDSSVTGTCGRCSSCMKSAEPRPADQLASSQADEAVALALIQAAHELGGKFGRHVVVDVITATVSEKVVSFRLDRSTTWGRSKSISRSHALRVLDEVIERGDLVRSSGQFPTIAPTAEGVRRARPLPKPMELQFSAAAGVDTDVLRALMSFRERCADSEGVAASTVVSLSALEALATDLPAGLPDIVPGKHGSGLFLARYGPEIVNVITHARKERITAVPKVRADAQVMAVVDAIRPGRTLADVARALRITPAAAAQGIQRAIESGVEIRREDLVQENVMASVMDFLRDHRFAKLRNVRDHVGDIAELPELRVAVAFARRELFGSA
ncbi:MAG: RecQ family ATP-dependent DNA helicase [Ignavibacteriae bacterium]|nr:MAG: RecQ family ATP-dependent DNA helicase [Ignavibacteriota bacterium]